MLLGLGAQVGHVDVAFAVAADDDDAQARHRRAGRVGAVRAAGDQADATRGLAAVLVVGADGQQACVLALAAGVGLQADAVQARGGGQPLRQVGDQRGVAARLRRWRERVDVGEARPGDRQHLRRGVQLHRAGAERDHAAVERHVAVLELLEVAQHRVFGVMRGEHRVGQERRGAQQGRGHRGGCRVRRSTQQRA